MHDANETWDFDLSGEHSHWRTLPPHIGEAWAFARQSLFLAHSIHFNTCRGAITVECAVERDPLRYLRTMLSHCFGELKAGRPKPSSLVDLGTELHLVTPRTAAIGWIRSDNWHFLGCELFDWTRKTIAIAAAFPSIVGVEDFWRDCALETLHEESATIDEFLLKNIPPSSKRVNEHGDSLAWLIDHEAAVLAERFESSYSRLGRAPQQVIEVERSIPRLTHDQTAVGKLVDGSTEFVMVGAWEIGQTYYKFRGDKHDLSERPLAILRLFVTTPAEEYSKATLLQAFPDLVGETALSSQLKILRASLREAARKSGLPPDVQKDPIPVKRPCWFFRMPRE